MLSPGLGVRVGKSELAVREVARNRRLRRPHVADLDLHGAQRGEQDRLAECHAGGAVDRDRDCLARPDGPVGQRHRLLVVLVGERRVLGLREQLRGNLDVLRDALILDVDRERLQRVRVVLDVERCHWNQGGAREIVRAGVDQVVEEHVVAENLRGDREIESAADVVEIERAVDQTEGVIVQPVLLLRDRRIALQQRLIADVVDVDQPFVREAAGRRVLDISAPLVVRVRVVDVENVRAVPVE